MSGFKPEEAPLPRSINSLEISRVSLKANAVAGCDPRPIPNDHNARSTKTNDQRVSGAMSEIFVHCLYLEGRFRRPYLGLGWPVLIPKNKTTLGRRRGGASRTGVERSCAPNGTSSPTDRSGWNGALQKHGSGHSML
jgi:hypothetical protein